MVIVSGWKSDQERLPTTVCREPTETGHGLNLIPPKSLPPRTCDLGIGWKFGLCRYGQHSAMLGIQSLENRAHCECSYHGKNI